MPATWRIDRGPHAWTAAEFPVRREFLPDRLEVIDGRLLLGLNDRINLLALLLESVGVDAAVRLGSLAIWEQAVEAAMGLPRETESRIPSWQVADDNQWEETDPPQPDRLPGESG